MLLWMVVVVAVAARVFLLLLLSAWSSWTLVDVVVAAVLPMKTTYSNPVTPHCFLCAYLKPAHITQAFLQRVTAFPKKLCS